jgi:ABC-type transport system substrate-binding protein
VLALSGGIKPAAEEPAPKEPTWELLPEPTEVLAEEPTEEAEEEPTEEPAEEPTEEPAEEPTEEPEATKTRIAPEYAFEPLRISAPCERNELAEIAAIDPLTVRFTLCYPDPAFLDKMAFDAFAIQPREWIEATGGGNEMLTRPIGTGRYQLEEWVPGDRIVFSRFEEYWGEPAVTQQVIFRWAADPFARLAALQSGEVDFVPYLPDEVIDPVLGSPDIQFLTAPGPSIAYLGMTNTVTPWDDVRVRRAIAMGIDRERIVGATYPPGSLVATHYTPCVIPNGCVGEEWYPFEPDYGRQLLAEAGYPDGFRTTLYYHDAYRYFLPDPAGVAIEIQAQLLDHLGIAVDLVEMEFVDFVIESTGGELDGLHLYGWGATYLHVNEFLDRHFSRYDRKFGDPHPEIFEVLEAAESIADTGTAAPLYEEANNAIRQLAPMVPLAHAAAAGTGAALADVEGAHVAVFGLPAVWKMDPGGRDVLVYMVATEPESLYSIDETHYDSLSACQMATESLYEYDEFGVLRPRLATSCEPAEDATVWTCTLRSGVRFHNGSGLDASDVVRSWDAGVNAASPYHTGRTGSFEYPDYLFRELMNSE